MSEADGTREFVSATCLLDKRRFTQVEDFRDHIKTVHRRSGLLIAEFTIKTETGATETRVEVPKDLIEALDDAEGEGVDDPDDQTSHDDVVRGHDECDRCKANKSRAFLPVHDRCDCTPREGWGDYIDSLVQPDAASDDQWRNYVTYLKRHAREIGGTS